MKKLLLGFSLIAVFGIGITAASFTLPENTNTTVEVKESEDKKKKKSLNNSMMAWLDKTKIADNKEVASSRGKDREDWMVRFFAFQARAKDPTKKVETARTVSKGTEKFVDYFEWGKEKMNQELGPQRAESLRQSGKIKWIPCPHTGSEDEHMKV